MSGIDFEALSEPTVIFGMCGCDDFNSQNTDFYKDPDQLLDAYSYFNGDMEWKDYEKFMHHYKNNWNDAQLKCYEQLDKIYYGEHATYISPFYASSCVTFCIFDGANIVAFMMVAKTLDTILLAEIFVKDEYRGHGVGKKLLQHLINLYGKLPIELHVSVANTNALNMYLKFRFNIMNVIEKYYSDKGKEPYTGDGRNAYNMIRNADTLS
jgi:ribosomal protein S18 acetylase RimI-like enzyme